MKAFQNIKKTKEKVILLLEQKPALRDDDNRLVAYFNYYEVGAEKFKLLSAVDYLNLLIDKKITPAQTILRARRKAQEERPELRGLEYKRRKLEAENVRENMRAIS